MHESLHAHMYLLESPMKDARQAYTRKEGEKKGEKKGRFSSLSELLLFVCLFVCLFSCVPVEKTHVSLTLTFSMCHEL